MGDLFSGIFGGGKGGGSSAPPPMPAMPQMDYGAIEGMMMNFENMMMGAMGSIAQAQQAAAMQQADMMAQMSIQGDMQLPSMPEAYRDPEIDWAEKQSQLAAKGKADFHLDQMRRKGRQDTILTSPLLDEEDATVTSSILAGE